MTTVAISGHFDPFHDMHLVYLKQGLALGDKLFCIVSTDRQLIAKKGRVNIPEEGRLEIVSLILKALNRKAMAVLNTFDTETTQVGEALRIIKPDIFLRGWDKSPLDLPEDERLACEKHNIMVVYAMHRFSRHGAAMIL